MGGEPRLFYENDRQMKTNVNYPRTLLVLVALISLFSCATVPISGRKQMNLLPDATMAQMGFTNYDAFMKENRLSADKVSSRMVEDAGKKISAAVNEFLSLNGMEDNLKYFEWEFRLVADPTPNAWCMPGGKVVFYEGILPFTRDVNGVAVVMGHEIAHAVARHGNERMSQQMVTQLGGLALAKTIEEKPEETRQIFLLVYGVGSQVGVLLPYSRVHEKEADRLGLIFMAMAGYDPRNAVEFWDRMSAANKGPRPPEWLSTHPLDETRMSDMKAVMPEALRYYEAAILKK